MSTIILVLVPWALTLLVAGYLVPRIRHKTVARSIGWTLAVLTTVLTVVSSWNAHALLRMIVIVSMQLLAMKVIVMAETYVGKPRLTIIQWLCFAVGWFGMRPTLFETLPSASRGNVWYFIVVGITRIVVGIGLLMLSKFIQEANPDLWFLHVACLLVGLSLMLHFGLLNLATAAWRFAGVNVRELFVAPYKATSLKEFWGKRWNLAFSEMTAIIVYKPLRAKAGLTAALFVSFLLSGLLHEMAISLPVRSGFGLPMSYFAIHGVVMYIEGNVPFVQHITAHKVLSHLWVWFWLIAPITLLFHAQFVLSVIQPLRDVVLNIMGAS